jgi:hypothetical protein
MPARSDHYKLNTIDDFIEYFAQAYGQLTGHNAVMMRGILSDAKHSPIAVWNYLHELCDKRKVVSPEFEAVLEEFWARFCH